MAAAEWCAAHERVLLVAGVGVAVALRAALALHPHSGQGKPPMYGDFEAQRHWLEITTALPPRDWYANTTENDLQYWGLDYPPLTAFHSYALGQAAHQFVPECVALGSSRGAESARCRLFMRATVILSDLLVYLPGAAVAVSAFAAPGESATVRVAATLWLWCHPALLLIDHGHFQYNGVCFGLCLWGAGLVLRGRRLAGSVLFTAALLFKQIALYYAPAFFAAILAQCVAEHGFCSVRSVVNVAATGSVVLLTASVLLAPWLLSPDPVGGCLQVLHRMFPFARGLYEDKVANLWCTISVVVKLPQLLPPGGVLRLCAGVTLAALAPACGSCLRRGAGRSPALQFACALTASALAFFLFAFQVHEKSILFPCMAAALLPVAAGPSRRPPWAAAASAFFTAAALFSMYPLVVKDRLHTAYAALTLATVAASECAPAPAVLRGVMRLGYLCGLCLHAVHAAVPPPQRYPDAWTLLFTGSSCAVFLCTLGAVTWAAVRDPLGRQGGGRKVQ
eukprot:TRINITY_DN61377_c0_g1_i1.p1 TRINITY_DN61377_c0_g1~~TRINITY_DN61377_c0_g1_i1.p1  ORF type:complete len:552 (+),score=162.84 TRINITY_DN61377_c0_g1_i1:134-1657(+)